MDDYLESVSDKIRKGEAVSFLDAIAAINYQGQLKAAKDAAWKKTFVGRCVTWVRALIGRYRT